MRIVVIGSPCSDGNTVTTRDVNPGCGLGRSGKDYTLGISFNATPGLPSKNQNVESTIRSAIFGLGHDGLPLGSWTFPAYRLSKDMLELTE